MKSKKSDVASATLRDRSLLTTSSILLILLATATSANAQIIPDNTLPNNTIVAPNGQTIRIEGGIRAGGNLFHSFREFNLGTGSTAFFNNAIDLKNILSRVTGGNISNIDGLIRANGGANLFFINPAGIVFGPNARLNIGGSFFASSADSVIFDDGSFFSATEPNAPPLLTINLPIGLQMGPNPGAIIVRGTGHKLRVESDFLPFNRADQLRTPTGLQVPSGNTLTIVGGDVTLDGGVLTALEGGVYLGSVKEGNVTIKPDGVLGYENARQFGDIRLLSLALADVSSSPSGGSAGSVQIQGRNLEVRGGSTVLIQNLGLEPAGNLTVNATESVNLIGSDPNDARPRGGLTTEALGVGDGGDIDVVTTRLLLSNGGVMGTTTQSQEILSPARGGDINILAPESVEIIGFSPVGATSISVIAAVAFGTGTAGDIALTTRELRAIDGGTLTSSAISTGEGGGNLMVDADLIEVIGVKPDTLMSSNISLFSLSQGEGGNLTINTRFLVVKGGGRVGATTGSTGPAGSVTINASESVFVSGIVPGSINPSIIDSSASILEEAFQQAFRLPAVPTGDTGELTINTPRLRVADGAEIGVQHEGTGNAGALRINAGSVLVERGAGITAAAASGLGGNLSLNVGDSLLLRNGGRITAEAGGGGDGGNLTINAQTIALLRNSNINANALQGAGGNIRMTTEGLFASADSAITASSQLGVQGTIEIEGIDGDPSVGLANLPANVLDATKLIASGCAEFSGSEYIVTGRGGLPIAIDGGAIATILTWRDWRRADTTNLGLSSVSAINIPEPPGNSQLVEATGWISRSDGVIELVADTGEVRDSWYQLPGCHSLN